MSEDPAKRVLLAEDNELNRKVMLAFLERLGYESEVAVDGPQTLDRIGSGDYDIVLMDIRMPGMNGVDVTRHIRTRDDIRQPYIIGVSASILESDTDDFVDAGMDDWLSKPVRLRELEDALARRD